MKSIGFLILLTVVLCGAFVLSVCSGSYDTPVGELLKGIFGLSADPKINLVVQNNRLPRICTAILAGAGLGITGCVLQAILRNPLASASTLGVSQGASFGAAFAIMILNVSSGAAIPICAFAGSMAVALVILGLSRFRQISAEGIVLAGVAISAMFTGATALLQYFADEIQPKVLLLDEPTSALDIQNQYQVLEIVREICKTEGITAIVVIHDLNLALRFCDRFLLMRQGKVYRCGGKEILDRKSLLDVYKVNAQITQVMGRNLIIVD